MKPTYSISKPCSEDWNKMTAEEQGRHCQICCKTVVDFSQKSDEEIIGFLEKNSSSKVCGRFRKEQLISTARIPSSKRIPRYRTFFAALILVFGGMLFSSCSVSKPGKEEVMGDVAYVGDTLKPEINPQDTAKVKIPSVDTTKKTGLNKSHHPKPIVADTVPVEPKYLMGDVAYTPDTLK